MTISALKSDASTPISFAPRISIVTVVRNGVRFIGQTIESVLQQSYPHIEYIVIDGGSTDGTVDAIKVHADRYAYWISEKDAGISDAFNKGLAHTTGEYVLFLNADDALAGPDVIERMVTLIEQYSQPAILYGDCDLLDRESEQVLSRTSIDFVPSKMMYGHMIPQPSMLTHRSYFEKYGNFDHAFKLAMDYEWLLRGALVERVVHVPMLVTCVHDGGVSTQSRSKAIDEISRALKKNLWIRSWVGECKLRGYFLARSLAKVVLKTLGLYKKHK